MIMIILLSQAGEEISKTAEKEKRNRRLLKVRRRQASYFKLYIKRHENKNEGRRKALKLARFGDGETREGVGSLVITL